MTDPKPLSTDLTVDEALLEDYDGDVPRHTAIIMDGNGRWAQERGLTRIRGHRAGAESVRAVVESCRYLGCDVLTLYAFSSENWKRPDNEVTGLMTLFDIYIEKERRRLIENDVHIQVIGDRSKLPDELTKSIENLESATAQNSEMILQVAVSYGGREEIIKACRDIATEAAEGEIAPEEIDEEYFERFLYTGPRPDPDLVIRTSGEKRLSNFLLWQVAYSEFFFTETLWPDFDESRLLDAFRTYSRRERRFGRTGEQLDEGSS